MKTTIEEHRRGLIDLYMDQLQQKNDTVFMKCVLREAIRRLMIKNNDPKKIENWVVKHDKETIKF
jgi:macrodomain Ter protein organizer (MatP/YcbG family)